MYMIIILIMIATIIFSVLYSALIDNRVVKLPGPASIGKANGKIDARSGLVFSSSLNNVMPNNISRARKNKTKAPATENSLTFIPIRFNIRSPRNRKTIITTVVMIEAFSL